ncbi:hypothetical protein [Curtobacterium sp. PhB136]|uniref:hypothetical protein n=1 Tax=Curtobacterium sp. PhB136 TaxID=2485181 RepID=UPI0010530B17|nr:hypothetical protein [Curtobacterium sp. PhB136]
MCDSIAFVDYQGRASREVTEGMPPLDLLHLAAAFALIVFVSTVASTLWRPGRYGDGQNAVRSRRSPNQSNQTNRQDPSARETVALACKQRRLAEGKTRRAVKCVLKRYIA